MSDILSEYGVLRRCVYAKQQLDAYVNKKKKENVIYELAKINGYKKMFSNDKEKNTKVLQSGYKFKGNGEFEYHLSCDCSVRKLFYRRNYELISYSLNRIRIVSRMVRI